MIITKITKNNGILQIKQIDKKVAKELIIKYHYSHKFQSNFGIYNFGIFKENQLLGCAVFGYMMNPSAKIFTSNMPDGYILELNRMWISDELKKNAETILISASIKLIKKLDKKVVAIQSFADGRIGCGTIYKASNFKYYGFLKSIFWQNKNTGEIFHNSIMTNTKNKSGYTKLNKWYLDDQMTAFVVKTYRYVYPLNKSFKLKFKEQPYPLYEIGSEQITPKRNIEKIIENLKRLNNE